MEAKKPTIWESYEEVARYLLEKMGDTLGLGLERVEGKQKLVGRVRHGLGDRRSRASRPTAGRSSSSSVAGTPLPSSSRKLWDELAWTDQ